MAITRNDCLLLLTDLKDNGVDIGDYAQKLYASKNADLIEVLKFINSKRQLDVTGFYQKIRKSYNEKRSSLYINIVREIENPSEVLTTLSAMLTQILLYARSVDDREMFLRNARAEEISSVLTNYLKTFDTIPCVKLLRLIKCDVKAVEYIDGREIE